MWIWVSFLGSSAAAAVTRAAIRTAFESAYREAYGRVLDDIAIRVMNMRVSVTGFRTKFDLALLAPKGEGQTADAQIASRKIWLTGAWCDAPVFERLRLPVGSRIEGPALFEQPDTTIYLEPGMCAEVDKLGNIVIARI